MICDKFLLIILTKYWGDDILLSVLIIKHLNKKCLEGFDYEKGNQREN